VNVRLENPQENKYEIQRSITRGLETDKRINWGNRKLFVGEKMGLCRIITWAIVGPMIIYAALIGQVAYLMFVEPDNLTAVTPFPSSMNQKDVDAFKSARQPLISTLKKILHGDDKAGKEFIEKYVTKNAEWEDPMQLFVGRDEISSFLKIVPKIIEHAEVTVKKNARSRRSCS